MGRPLQVAVVGGGWAGLAAAVDATRRGHQVVLYEMASRLGGRARRVDFDGLSLDNGQHILIGAYRETQSLMTAVGLDIERAFVRTPLRVCYPDGSGLKLPTGSPMLAFTRGVLAYDSWRLSEKMALLQTATSWAIRRFRCGPDLTVAQLVGHLPLAVREQLLDPLCVAALNTPSTLASASVFLRVLKDALFSGPGSADLLYPRLRLSALWPEPAAAWLQQRGAAVRTSARVQALTPAGEGWQVDGQAFDAVLLACTALEAARLVDDIAPGWASEARALDYEPIVTVYARSAGTRLPHAMLALHHDAESPAQFVFDLGQLDGPEGMLAFVVSGAATWVERGQQAAVDAVLTQGSRDLSTWLAGPLQAVRTTTEKRATFLCTPHLRRPAARILPRLWAAGDYVEGPYPATLEGAVISGLRAARGIE